MIPLETPIKKTYLFDLTWGGSSPASWA